MKIAIVGAGAMGSLFGAKLSHVADVWLVDPWAAHVHVMQREGLLLTRLDGESSAVLVQATTDPDEVGGQVDLAIIFVKAHQTAEAARWTKPLLRPTGLALTLQNGLGNLEAIAGVLGPEHAIQGVTAHGATLVGPGQVRHAGHGMTYIASRPSVQRQLDQVIMLFKQAGFETEASDNLDALLWGKLIVNVGINPLTAILRVLNGQLVEVKEAEDLMMEAVDEAVRVAESKGISLPYDDAHERIRTVAIATADNRSSMFSDVLRRVPTEIDVINGAVVREGAKVGIPTPVNQSLVRLIKAIEATYGS
jgi:2-dehydropantoate 2-reductase